MNVLADSWSLGVLVGLPVTVLAVVIGVAAVALGIRYSEGPAVLAGAVVVVCTVAIAGWAFYPYSAEYHQWREVTGEVAAIDKRILPAGESIEEKFVVRYRTGEERGCLDTRCSLVKPGDQLTLTCKRAWQFAGVDGYDCNYVGRG